MVALRRCFSHRIYAETLCVPGLADDGLAFAPVAVAIGYLISGDRGRFRATSFATKSLFSSTSSSGAGDGDALTDPTINRILNYDSVSQRARGLPLPSGATIDILVVQPYHRNLCAATFEE